MADDAGPTTRRRARDRTGSPMLLAAFLGAILLNASGFLFGWFHTVGFYDECLHAFTTFTVTALLMPYLAPRTGALPGSSLLLMAGGLGLTLGLFWEMFEWSIGIIGDRADTLIDLLMDTAGAYSAGLYAYWFRARLLSSRRSIFPG